MAKPDPTQSRTFREAAGALERDEGGARFDESVGKLVKHQPVPRKAR